MNIYKGIQDASGGVVTVNDEPLDPRLDLWNHSFGFNWGYGGSGPAQLALAILADHLGDDRQAVMLYQAFKWAVVAQMPIDEPWELTSEEIDMALREMKEDER